MFVYPESFHITVEIDYSRNCSARGMFTLAVFSGENERAKKQTAVHTHAHTTVFFLKAAVPEIFSTLSFSPQRK